MRRKLDQTRDTRKTRRSMRRFVRAQKLAFLNS